MSCGICKTNKPVHDYYLQKRENECIRQLNYVSAYKICCRTIKFSTLLFKKNFSLSRKYYCERNHGDHERVQCDKEEKSSQSWPSQLIGIVSSKILIVQTPSINIQYCSLEKSWLNHKRLSDYISKISCNKLLISCGKT